MTSRSLIHLIADPGSAALLNLAGLGIPICQRDDLSCGPVLDFSDANRWKLRQQFWGELLERGPRDAKDDFEELLLNLVVPTVQADTGKCGQQEQEQLDWKTLLALAVILLLLASLLTLTAGAAAPEVVAISALLTAFAPIAAAQAQGGVSCAVFNLGTVTANGSMVQVNTHVTTALATVAPSLLTYTGPAVLLPSREVDLSQNSRSGGVFSQYLQKCGIYANMEFKVVTVQGLSSGTDRKGNACYP